MSQTHQPDRRPKTRRVISPFLRPCQCISSSSRQFVLTCVDEALCVSLRKRNRYVWTGMCFYQHIPNMDIADRHSDPEGSTSEAASNIERRPASFANDMCRLSSLSCKSQAMALEARHPHDDTLRAIANCGTIQYLPARDGHPTTDDGCRVGSTYDLLPLVKKTHSCPLL